MLEHLKRILISLIDWHNPNVIWNTENNLGIDETETSGTHAAEGYDELTILHTADQVGELRVSMGRTDPDTRIVDTIPYVADEVISRVYSITGLYVYLAVTNGGVAQTDRSTIAMLRKT